STASFGGRSAHDSQTVDENNATSHGASGRGKSARSSWRGTGYTSRGGASGVRRRMKNATHSTTTTIAPPIRSRSTASASYGGSGTATLVAVPSAPRKPMPTATGRVLVTSNTSEPAVTSARSNTPIREAAIRRDSVAFGAVLSPRSDTRSRAVSGAPPG